jgi:MFS family permease
MPVADAILLERPSDGAGGVKPWSLYGDARRWMFLVVLLVVTTSNYFDYFVLSVVLEPIKREFGVSDTELGLLSGICFAIFYVLGALPIARLADRGDRRAVLSLSVAGWSVFTILCGFAQTYWQLIFARIGVGATEPGGVPTAQSLAADYFPPERRATALIILTQGGSALGYLVGIGVGGSVAARYGWRSAFLVGGIAGLGLAVVVRAILDEPRRRPGFAIAATASESMREALDRLWRKRSVVAAIAGISIYCIFSYGIAVFLPSFMMRTLHATLEQVSVSWGIVMSVASLSGAIAGGWLADTLSRRTVRWYALLPMWACLVAGPIYWIAFNARSLRSFIAIEFVAEVVLSAGMPACFAAVHVVCGAGRRAMAMAAMQFLIILFGGYGPLIAGAMSDALQLLYGADSLRQSLTLMLVFLAPAAFALYLCSRAMPRELED